MAEVDHQHRPTNSSTPPIAKTSRTASVSAGAPTTATTSSATTPVRTSGRRLAIVVDRLPDKSFGLTLAGERPCRIRDVAPVTATKSGAKAGFQLVAVDGEDVSDLPHETIIDIFRKCKKNTLMLAVLAFATNNNSADDNQPQTGNNSSSNAVRENSTAPSTEQRRRSSQQQQQNVCSPSTKSTATASGVDKQLKTISFVNENETATVTDDALTHVDNNINHVNSNATSHISADAGDKLSAAPNKLAVVDVHQPPSPSVNVVDLSVNQTSHAVVADQNESALATNAKPKRSSRRQSAVENPAETSARSTSRHQPATFEATTKASPNTAARISSRHHRPSSNTNKLHSGIGSSSSAAASRKSFLTQLYVKSNRALYELLVIQATQNQPQLVAHYRLHDQQQRAAVASTSTAGETNPKSVEVIDHANARQPVAAEATPITSYLYDLKPIKRRLSAPGSLQRFSAAGETTTTSSAAPFTRAKRSKRHRNQTRDLQKFLSETKQDKRTNKSDAISKSGLFHHQYSEAQIDFHRQPRQSRQQQDQTRLLTAMQHDGAAQTARTLPTTTTNTVQPSTSSSSAVRVRRKTQDKFSSKFVAAEVPLAADPTTVIDSSRSGRTASSPPAVQSSPIQQEQQIAVGTRQPRDRRVTHYTQYECRSERRHLCEFEPASSAAASQIAATTTMPQHHAAATEHGQQRTQLTGTNTLPRAATAAQTQQQQQLRPPSSPSSHAAAQTLPITRRAKTTSASVRIPRVRRTAAPYNSSGGGGGGGQQPFASNNNNRAAANTAEWHAYQQPVTSPFYPSYHQQHEEHQQQQQQQQVTVNPAFRHNLASAAAQQQPLVSDSNPLDVMIKYYDSIHDPLGGSQEPVFREHIAFLKKLSQTTSAAQSSTIAPVSSSSSSAATTFSSSTAATTTTPHHHHAPMTNSDKHQMAVVAISSGHKPFSWTRLVITQNRLILRNCRGVLASYAPKHIFQTFLDDDPSMMAANRLAKISNSSQDFTSLPPADAASSAAGSARSAVAPQFFGFSTVRSYHTKKNDSDSPIRFELYSCHVLQVEPALHNSASDAVSVKPDHQQQSAADNNVTISDQLRLEREKIVKKVCSVEEWSKMVHSDSAFPATPVDIVDAINHLRRLGSMERRESRDKTTRLQHQQQQQTEQQQQSRSSGSTKRHRQASSSSSAAARQQHPQQQSSQHQIRPKAVHTSRQATSLSLQAPHDATNELSVRRHSTSTPRERRRRVADVKSESSSSSSSESSCSSCSRSSRTSSNDEESGESSERSFSQPSSATAAHSTRSAQHRPTSKSRPKSTTTSSTRRRTRHSRGTTSAADVYGYEQPLAVENELLVEQPPPHDEIEAAMPATARPQRPSSLRFVQQQKHHHHHRHSHRDRPKQHSAAETLPAVAQAASTADRTQSSGTGGGHHQRRHNPGNTVCFASEVEVLAFEESALNVPSVKDMVDAEDIARLAQGKIVRKHRIKLPSGVMKEINVDNKENFWPATTQPSSAAPVPKQPVIEEDMLKGNGKEPASRTTSSNNRPMPPSATGDEVQVSNDPPTVTNTTTTTVTAVVSTTATVQQELIPAATTSSGGVLKSPATSRQSSSSPRPLSSSRRKASEPVTSILRNRRIDEITRLDEKRHSQAAIPAIPPEWAHMDIASMHIGSPQRGMSFGSTTSSMGVGGSGLPLVIVGAGGAASTSGEPNSSTPQSSGAGVVGGWRLSEPHAAHPGHPHPGSGRIDPSKPPDNIDEVLEDPLGVMAFREFLSHEYSEENLLFWLSCEQLKNQFNDDPILCGPINKQDLRNTAHEIYERFLNPTSEQAVNVDARARALAQRLLDDPDPTIFNVPQEQIYKLMKFDSFPRFRKSDRCHLFQAKWIDTQKQLASGTGSGGGDKAGAHGQTATGGAAADKKAGIVSGLFSRFAGKRTRSLRDKRGRTLPGGAAGTEPIASAATLHTTTSGPGGGGGAAATGLSKTPPSGGAADASMSRMQSIKQRLFKSGRKSAGRSPSPGGATTPRATTPGPGGAGTSASGGSGGNRVREPSKQASAANLLTIQPDMPSEERRRHSMVSMQYLSGQQKQPEPGKTTTPKKSK